jgi:hypothetical protein
MLLGRTSLKFERLHVVSGNAAAGLSDHSSGAGKQRHRKIAPRESFRHDSRANHGRGQEHRPPTFGDKRPGATL